MSRNILSSLLTTFLLPVALIALVGACAGVDDDAVDASNESTGGASSGGSSVGGSSSGGSAIGGYTGSQPATLDTIGTVVQQGCGGPACHNGETDLLMQKNDELYNTLMTYQSSHCEMPLVTPGDPSRSALVKIVTEGCGEIGPMPKGCILEPDNYSCLPPDYIEAMERWVLEGAPP